MAKIRQLIYFHSLHLRLRNLLCRRSISIAIVLIAIAARIIQLVFFYNIRVDASYQVMATQNFVNGHGISTATVLPSDLAFIIYEPLINWPPGYSVLLAPFYLLFNPNYIAAGITLDIVAAITLLMVSRRILFVLDVPVYLRNSYTLVSGFFIYYFYFIASSDAIAISVFIVALYITLLLLKKRASWLSYSAAIAFLLFICAAIKYLFMPVIFVIPIYLVLKGFADKDVVFRKAGLLIFLMLTLTLGGLLGYQKYLSGSATYISSGGRGFLPENLLTAFPFITGSFSKPDTIALLFRKLAKVEDRIFEVYQLVHCLLLVFLSAFFIKHLLQKRLRQLTLPEHFFYLLFCVSGVTTLLLSVLSVHITREEILPGVLWTYVEEPRYYGLPNVMLHLGFFIFYSHYYSRVSRLMQYLLIVAGLFLATEVLRGIYFDAHRLSKVGVEEYSWQTEDRIQRYADEVLKRRLRQQPVKKIVLTGSSFYINHRVSLYSYVPILKSPASINDLSSLKTSEPVLLFIILRKKDLDGFQSFLLNKEVKAEGDLDDYFFYTLYVRPH